MGFFVPATSRARSDRDFGFLSPYGSELAKDAARAQDYIESDPTASLMKSGIVCEIITKLIRDRTNVVHFGEETHERLTSRINQEGHIPDHIKTLLDQVRIKRNKATHDGKGTPADAYYAVMRMYRVAGWFVGVNGDQSDAPVSPPAPPPRPPPPRPPPSPPPQPPLSPSSPSPSATVASGASATTPVAGSSRSSRPRPGLIAAAFVAIGALGWLIANALGSRSGIHPPYPIDAFPSPETGTVSSSAVNVRRGPGAQYETVEHLQQGQRVIAYGIAKAADGGTWDYVKLADSTFGYANSKLLTVQPTSQATTSPPNVVADQTQQIPVSAPQPTPTTPPSTLLDGAAPPAQSQEPAPAPETSPPPAPTASPEPAPVVQRFEVIAVQPVYQQNDNRGAQLGAGIGGLVGSQAGQGRANAAAIGSLLGRLVGSAADQSARHPIGYLYTLRNQNAGFQIQVGERADAEQLQMGQVVVGDWNGTGWSLHQ